MKASQSGLLIDFAIKDPANFVASLEHSTEAEVILILEQLPDPVAASVVAKLPARMAENILQEDSAEHLKWIKEGALEDVKAILIRLPANRRKALVRKLPKSAHRLQLQRFLSYPQHSLGRAVSTNIITVPVDMTTADVISLIKSSAPGLPVVVVNTKGKYEGLLDARKVLEGSTQISIKNFIDKVRPLTAESALVDAADLEQWQRLSVLAVVDHEGQVLGVISQEKLMRSLNLIPETIVPTNSLALVFNLFIQVMTRLSTFLLTYRKQS